MIISIVSVSVFAANSYSGFNPITGAITLEDSTIEINKDDTFKVYVSVNLDAVSKDKVTAFHILGTLSDNLEIVSSGFADDENLTKIPTPTSSAIKSRATPNIGYILPIILETENTVTHT